MRPSRVIAASAAAALTLFTLSACADAPTDGEKTDGPVSPLTPYYDAAYGTGVDTEAQQKEWDEQQAKIEQAVAVCMTEQGFEYTPVPVEPQSSVDVGADDGAEDWNPDEKAWVEQWGYGIVDWPGREEMTDDSYAEESSTEGASDDPNLAYYESLSEGEQTAYDEALWGPSVNEEILPGESLEYDWKQSGCSGKASHDLGLDADSMPDLSEFEGLLARMDELSKDMPDAPEVAALDGEWAACMQESGHAGFTTQTSAWDSIAAELDEFFPETDEASPDAASEELPDLSPESNPEIAELQEREIELALADLSCREQTSYQEEYQRITFAKEQEFLDANRAELDAMKLAAEQAN